MTDREKLIDIRNQIDEHLSGEEIVTEVNAEFSAPDRIKVTWKANTDKDYACTIWYWADSEQERKRHAQQFRKKFKSIQDESDIIGLRDPATEDWNLQLEVGEWDAENYKIINRVHLSEPVEIEMIEEEPPDAKPIFFGYWDAHAAPDNQPANIYKLPWNDLDRFPGSKVIPMIGGFRHDDSEADIRKRLSDRKNHIDSASDVEWVMLMDEPFYKNFTPEKQELLIQCAKEEMGDYKYGFAYARGALVDQPDRDRRIPSNLDVAMVNYYPFYHRDYIEHHEWWHMWITKEAEFQNDLEKVLDKLKDVPEVYLTGQGHKSDDSQSLKKYRQPPLESVQWYVNACYKYGLKGVLWWLWESRSRAIGMGEMPELYEEHKRVFETIPK